MLKYLQLTLCRKKIEQHKIMKTDIEIARETKLKNIREIAAKVGFPEEELFNYGKYIAKEEIKK